MSHNDQPSDTGGRITLAGILNEMNDVGDFEISVLTSDEGLPIATAPPDHDSELAAAMVALLQKVSNDAQSQIGMALVDEVTIRDQNRFRLVCRRIVVGQEELILSAIVPPDHYYRRVTNRAIKRIRQLLS